MFMAMEYRDEHIARHHSRHFKNALKKQKQNKKKKQKQCIIMADQIQWLKDQRSFYAADLNYGAI